MSKKFGFELLSPVLPSGGIGGYNITYMFSMGIILFGTPFADDYAVNFHDTLCYFFKSPHPICFDYRLKVVFNLRLFGDDTYFLPRTWCVKESVYLG
jgi:hypothetical protein